MPHSSFFTPVLLKPLFSRARVVSCAPDVSLERLDHGLGHNSLFLVYICSLVWGFILVSDFVVSNKNRNCIAWIKPPERWAPQSFILTLSPGKVERMKDADWVRKRSPQSAAPPDTNRSPQPFSSPPTPPPRPTLRPKGGPRGHLLSGRTLRPTLSRCSVSVSPAIQVTLV